MSKYALAAFLFLFQYLCAGLGGWRCGLGGGGSVGARRGKNWQRLDRILGASLHLINIHWRELNQVAKSNVISQGHRASDLSNPIRGRAHTEFKPDWFGHNRVPDNHF
jgi:hypothetical protein